MSPISKATGSAFPSLTSSSQITFKVLCFSPPKMRRFLGPSLSHFAQCLPTREVQCLYEINAGCLEFHSVGAACAGAQAVRLCWQPGPSGQLVQRRHTEWAPALSSPDAAKWQSQNTPGARNTTDSLEEQIITEFHILPEQTDRPHV